MNVEKREAENNSSDLVTYPDGVPSLIEVLGIGVSIEDRESFSRDLVVETLKAYYGNRGYDITDEILSEFFSGLSDPKSVEDHEVRSAMALIDKEVGFRQDFVVKKVKRSKKVPNTKKEDGLLGRVGVIFRSKKKKK